MKTKKILNTYFWTLTFGFLSIGFLISIQEKFTPPVLSLALIMYCLIHAFLIVFRGMYTNNDAMVGEYFGEAMKMVKGFRQQSETIMTPEGPMNFDEFSKYQKKLRDNPCPICKANMELDPNCSTCDGKGYIEVTGDEKEPEKPNDDII